MSIITSSRYRSMRHDLRAYVDASYVVERLILESIQRDNGTRVWSLAIRYYQLAVIADMIDPNGGDSRRAIWAQTRRMVDRLYDSAVRLRVRS